MAATVAVITWINTHKALIGSIAAALAAAAPVVPPPYNGILLGVSTILAALAGGQYAAQSALKSQSRGTE